MKQKNVIIRNIDELRGQLPALEEEFSSCDYVSGLIEIYVGNIPKDELSEILGLLKKSFPKLEIVGMASIVSLLALYNDPKGAVISFTLMQHGGVKVFSRFFESSKSDFELLNEAIDYARYIREEIRTIDNAKGIEMFVAGRSAPSSAFLKEFSIGLEDIPIYGAAASSNMLDMRNVEKDFLSKHDTFAIAGESFGRGLAFAVFCGKDLHVYVEYLFGWEPVGRYMDITTENETVNGSICVTSLDGDSPVHIYEKYLGVKHDRAFIANIGEFPLIIERDGLLIGRTPSSCNKKGEVYIEGDILEGEKVRFSFGDAKEILAKTKNAAARMKTFGAQYINLIICGNRLNFLKDDYHFEVDCYTEALNATPMYCLGLGEIYRYGGRGGLLNSALIAVGMREGINIERSYSVAIKKLEPKYKNDIIPLASRLSHFLRALTDELNETVKKAESANDAKSAFLSNMSHEIRTPINAVLGMDEMILRECEDPRILEYAQNIKSAGSTLLGLINDILDFSKIESGKMDIISVDYDFSSLINDLVHMVKPKAQEKGLDLIVDVDNQIPSVLCGDEIRIKQVATNLLSNAVKYTENGYVDLNIKHEMIGDGKAVLTFTIKDSGIGIKEEDLGNLTEAFRRVDEERNRTIEGTGLGLNITKKLLELMGSELKVKSEYGMGSEFSFDIVQGVKKSEPIGDYMETYKKALIEQIKYHERFVAPDARVLVVDDTPINLDVFEGLLKTTKVMIDRAESGFECLELTRENRYDIIFLDHRMPDMDGVETLQRLKADEDNKNREVPVICLTANAVSGARETYIQIGFDEYLTKPIMAEELENMMTKFLPSEKVKIERTEVGADDQAEIDFDALPSWIKNAPLPVLEQGIKNCGSQEAYVTAAMTYRNGLEDNYNAIKEAFEKGDIKNFTIKVHSLKSSSRIVGINNLAELAEKLEKAGDENDIDFINKETPRLLAVFKTIWERILSVPESEEEEDDNLTLMDEKGISDAKNTLRELVQSFDYDSINYVMETINGYKVPAEHREFFKLMKKAISDADWDRMRNLLEEGGNDGQ
ncbi:response regulator [Butyrivibrio sp. FC2001]|uniref:response regulator n=1 Tax=Butyrivibrio sp. FC2001 TaxID=1280671 RepID=UPI0003FA53F1|nr:response regulator [Butyrivibrio sp. FC2001]